MRLARSVRGLAWVALACALHAGGAAAASERARELVQRAQEAGRTLDYDGVFVYQRDNELDTMRLIHRGSGATEVERLVSLSGPAREVIRDGTRVTCTFADDKAVMVEKRLSRDLLGFDLSEPVESLTGLYDFSLGPDDRIAGRAARVVRITPLTVDRYGYRLWIDEQTGLLLKSAVLDHDQRPLEQVEFARIDVGGPIDDALLAPEVSGVDFTWYNNDGGANAAEDGGSEWLVGWLPGGFEMRDQQTRHLVPSRMPVRHFVYSDGLATVSVFIEKLGDDTAPIQGHSSMGAVSAFSRVADGFQITVVGEVPQSTVRQIAVATAKRRAE
jgi:sigma-E factor negative regulatory protein RseB